MLKLPQKELLIKKEYERLYDWDIKEYFTKDVKNYWAIYYKNRIEHIINYIEHFKPKGKMVLDIGCAQATVSIILAEKGYKVIASDINLESLEYASMRYEFGECNFIVLNAEKLPFKNKFDVIILGEFLEHVAHPDKILEHYNKFLNNDGIIIVSTPNGSAPHNWKFQSYEKLTKKNKMFHEQFGPERDDHVFNFKHEELKNLFLKCNYKILISDYINSYFINPLNLHKVLPYSIVKKINISSSKLPFLKKYICIGLIFIGQKK